jgi:uncharacterized membrane protein (DUF441 family)
MFLMLNFPSKKSHTVTLVTLLFMAMLHSIVWTTYSLVRLSVCYSCSKYYITLLVGVINALVGAAGFDYLYRLRRVDTLNLKGWITLAVFWWPLSIAFSAAAFATHAFPISRLYMFLSCCYLLLGLMLGVTLKCLPQVKDESTVPRSRLEESRSANNTGTAFLHEES